MASSDDGFNKLDTLSDDDYLKLIEKFYEKVRKKNKMFCFFSNLISFSLKNANNFAFPELDLDKKQRLVTELFTRIRSFNSNSINLCLKTLRLLTREREGLDVKTKILFY